MKVYSLIFSLLIASLGFSQADLNLSIGNILKSHGKSESDPGLTVGIVKDGELIYHSSKGCMNLQYQLPYNDSTVFGLASVTKQFTAACIAVLEKEGKLSVQDAVRKYIPELASYQDTIRIKHLLNHTSGIRNHNALLDLQGFDFKHQGYTNETIQQLMFKQKGINNLPGEKMLYSNTNYVLLALLIERVSGMPIHQFAKQELFDPLGMTSTFYSSNLEDIIKNRAHTYYMSNGRYFEPKSLTHCIGAGGVGSTIADLQKWSDVFLSQKHEFSYLKSFITALDTLNNGMEMKHARGMFVSPYKGFTTFNHSGRDLGMRAQFICVPEISLAVIVYSNSEDINAVNVSYELLDLFIDQGTELKLEEEHFNHSTSQIKQFEGVFQELNSDLRMDFFIENDTLRALSSFGRNAIPLVSESANSLCRKDNRSIVYTFQKEAISGVDLTVDFGGAIFYFERIELDPNPNRNLDEFAGTYHSDELNVTYSISIENKQLVLNYPNNYGLQLSEGVTDTFGANRRTKYTFNRNKNGQVVSFVLASEGTVKDVFFEKANQLQ